MISNTLASSALAALFAFDLLFAGSFVPAQSIFNSDNVNDNPVRP